MCLLSVLRQALSWCWGKMSPWGAEDRASDRPSTAALKLGSRQKVWSML